MAGNSLPRRFVKKFIVPFIPEGMRQYIQAAAMIKDFRDNNLIKAKEPEALWARKHLKPGETALDVGANFGLYTYHLSKAVGDTGKVVSFEPIPATATTLKKVCRLLRLKNVSIVEKGCSNEPGVIKFSVPLQANRFPRSCASFVDDNEECKRL